MGLIDLASSNSLWRGIDYYQSKNVNPSMIAGVKEELGIVVKVKDRRYHKHPGVLFLFVQFAPSAEWVNAAVVLVS